MKNYLRLINTPIGKMIAVADENAILSLDFTAKSVPVQNSDTPLLIRLEEELREYFEGKRKIFTLPLAPDGTPFQKKVWETLRIIPYGETISYAEEAKLFGNAKAIRAVASANGRNPISILIPCHRVIATGGGLGGYSGGVWKKEFLLELEKEVTKKV
jgi:methylated-DNA-[protein]-cysteine S-methyltransferase